MDNYWKNSRRGNVNRRTLLRGAIGGSAGVAGLWLLACSSSNNNGGGNKSNAAVATTAASATRAGTAAPPAGTARPGGSPAAAGPAGSPAAQVTRRPGPPVGSLNVSTASLFEMTPIDAFPTGGGSMTVHSVEGFQRYGPDGSIQPALAVSMESPDTSTFIFKMRPNVKFWDGSTVTADDAAWSYQTYVTQNPAPSNAKIAQNLVASVTATDPATVTVKYSKPSAVQMLDLNITGPRGWPIASRAFFEKVGMDTFTKKTPMLTGPFKLTGHETASFDTFEANEQYWDPNRVPRVKNLRADVVPDVNTRVSRLRAGETQMIDAIGGDAAQALQKESNLKVITVPGITCLLLNFFDLGQAPWSDPRLREAMTIAIDQDQIIKGLLRFGSPSSGVEMFPSTQGFDANIFKPRTYDPARAKQLVQAAGLQGYKFDVGFYDAPSYAQIPQVVQAVGAFWQAVGLSPNLQQQDAGAFTGKYPSRSLHGVGIRTFQASLGPNAAYVALIWYKPGQPFSWLEAAGIDADIAKVESLANDPAAQLKAAVDVNKKLYDNFDMITFPYANANFGATNKVNGWDMGGNTGRLYDLETVELSS